MSDDTIHAPEGWGRELEKSLTALYLALPAEIVEHHSTIVRTRIATLETALEAADRLHDAIDATVAKGGATLWAERYEAMRAYRTARTVTKEKGDR